MNLTISEELFSASPLLLQGKPLDFTPITQHYTPLFIVLLLGGALLSLSILITLQPQAMRLIFDACFFKKHYSQLIRERHILKSGIFLVLFLIVCLVESLSFYCIIDYYNIKITSLFSEFDFLILLAILTGYFTIYLLIASLSNYLFDYQKINFLHRHCFLISHLLISIVSFPLIALIFCNRSLHFGVILCTITALFYLLSIGRQLYLYVKNVKLFYFFFYFCSIEILPVFIVVKFYFRLCE